MNVGTVAEAVTTLYGGDPADFVAVRKELAAAARTAGERDAAREIAALRKPTAAAAAVNHLDDGAISDVLALGEQMRAAQTSLDAATLKELSARRQELLQQIVTRHDLNGAPAEAVRATLLAAIADRQAADAVATRALVRPQRVGRRRPHRRRRAPRRACAPRAATRRRRYACPRPNPRCFGRDISPIRFLLRGWSLPAGRRPPEPAG